MKNTLIAIVILAFFTACSREPESTGITADPVAGKAFAIADCSECHGMDGRGRNNETPNLAAQSADYLVEAMHAYRDGERQHAAIEDMTEGMTESDISNIAAYYAALPPLEPLTGPDQSGHSNAYSEGAAVAAVCIECHGELGISTTPGTPNLAGQQPIYLIFSILEYKNGSRGHFEKEQMLSGLNTVDIEKMAMYFASQVAPLREPPLTGDPQAGEGLSADCVDCHGERGVSHDPYLPSLAGQEPQYLASSLMAYRDHQRSHQDMITDLSDQEIESIAAYFALQQAGTALDEPLTGQQLAAKCNRCHDSASKKRAMIVPSLNGQKFDYLVLAMTEYRDNDRENSMMHKMSASYTDEMIEAIASYYASIPE